MTELAYWWTTTGTPSGDQQSSYTQVHLATIAEILAACSGFEGVVPGYLNQLECTDGGANTVDVDTGGAVVDGKPYLNDATINVNVPSAVGGGNTRIDRIVVRVTWASFTGAVTRIAGTDAASPSAPAITQTSGTTYDIKLCQALVDTSGNITVTDERDWAQANEAKYRQGGSSTIWSTAGTSDYAIDTELIQKGTVTLGSVSNGDDASAAVTFAKAYAYAPLIIAQGYFSDLSALTTIDIRTVVGNATTTGFYVGAYNNTGNARTIDVHWIAFGPPA